MLESSHPESLQALLSPCPVDMCQHVAVSLMPHEKSCIPRAIREQNVRRKFPGKYALDNLPLVMERDERNKTNAF